MTSRSDLNTSASVLFNRRSAKVVPENPQDELYRKQKKRARREGLKHLYQSDYKPADYHKAVLYKDSMSYKKKVGVDKYIQIETFGDTEQLKAFGLGIYFFTQYQRRIVWLFFVFSLFEAVRLYINWNGSGLANYTGSIITFFIMSTIGNYNKNVISPYDNYIVTIIPCAIFLTLFLFHLLWHRHYEETINKQNQQKEFAGVGGFCVQVQGFHVNDKVKQKDLQKMFEIFGPIYEINLVREYNGSLKHFQKFHELQQEIKQKDLEVVLGSESEENLSDLLASKQNLKNYINRLRIRPSVRSAYIHFQYKNSKEDMLEFYSDHFMLSKNSHQLAECLCACYIEDIKPEFLYKNTKKIYVKNPNPPEPEDINWNHYDSNFGGKLFWFLFVVLVILLFLFISCTIIGLCSVYIASNSVSCEQFYIPSLVNEAQMFLITESQRICYCNKNFLKSFDNERIKTYCGQLRTEMYYQQGIQLAIPVIILVINLIFSSTVHKLVQLMNPFSYSVSFVWETNINTAFLIFNTVFLPLLMYADIFGFRAVNYVSIITILSNDVRSFLDVQNLRLYFDFEKIWYRNVSAIFINYIIIDLIFTWLYYVFHKVVCFGESLKDKQGKILQKSMNEQIVSFKFSASNFCSMFRLIIFMSIFYNAGSPILILFASLNLFSKYFVSRSLLQGESSKIEGLSEAFNPLPLMFFPLLLILASVVGCWTLTANEVIFVFTDLKITIPISFQMLGRQLILPFFIILAIVIVLHFLLSNTIGRSMSCSDKGIYPDQKKMFSEYANQMNHLRSYNIRNNSKFKNAIFTIEKYLNDSYFE